MININGITNPDTLSRQELENLVTNKGFHMDTATLAGIDGDFDLKKVEADTDTVRYEGRAGGDGQLNVNFTDEGTGGPIRVSMDFTDGSGDFGFGSL